MNLVFLLSPFARLLSGWFSRPQATASRLDVSQACAVKVERPTPVDPLVPVTGPSTVIVFQNKRVRVLIDWPHEKEGEVSVPLRTVDDGSGPLFVWVLTEPELRESLAEGLRTACHPCVARGPAGLMEKCCG